MQLELARDHRPRPPHPLKRRTAEQRRRFRRGVYLLPSVFTLGNMFCGYICIVYSIRGDFETAAPFIAFSVVLDMLDGRIARLTGSTSAFGLEFDSLADVVSFGVAPAILTVSWGLTPLGRLGWAAGFIFVTAGAIRLARFNIQASTDKRHFVGMPIPAAAAVPASTVYVYPAGLQDVGAALPALALMIVPAVLMVSTIRFRSFKSIDLRWRRSSRVLLLLALFLMAIATHPRWTLLALAYTYLLSAFVAMAAARLRRRAAPAGAPISPPPPPEPPPAG
ncbi:MAG TPA: CDP-diacylglycerol--serine O-phosphatidyltransferase [Vicinamibacterales bacterium]|nr:CDP-diacylglycerol--serine O-phosphatidyltransferase [Acidobacteriota bacterium]HOC19090.1 CDP-diacylglycerol--serine O-phosphatidyltransferase [Vicinamibacterales bacterium]